MAWWVSLGCALWDSRRTLGLQAHSPGLLARKDLGAIKQTSTVSAYAPNFLVHSRPPPRQRVRQPPSYAFIRGLKPH